MFGKKANRKEATTESKKAKIPQSSKIIDTVIGKNTELKGTIKSTGTVRVDGTFEGEIETTSDLVIGEEGIVRAQVKAVTVIIAGNLEGDIDCQGRLELVPTGTLVGNAKAGILVIEEGATFKGQIEMSMKSGQTLIKQTVATKKDSSSS